MGIDPVDSKFLLDKLEIDLAMEGVEHLNLREEVTSRGKMGVRWIPPRAFSRGLMLDMFEEKIEEYYK